MDGSVEAWKNSRLSSKIGSSHSCCNAFLTSAAIYGLKTIFMSAKVGQEHMTIPDESRAPAWTGTYMAICCTAAICKTKWGI